MKACWIHPYTPTENGYVQSRQHSPTGRKLYVHRRAYELAFDVDLADYPGMEVDHLCKVRACFNPDHLELVTTQENTRRRDIGRVLRGRTPRPYVDRPTMCLRCGGPLRQIDVGRPRKYCDWCIQPSHAAARKEGGSDTCR